jgi:hypothetical protein
MGRAVAQTVSRRVPTTAARIQSQVRSCGICGEQSGSGTGFLHVLQFPLPILIPPNALYSSTGVDTICEIVADVPRGHSLTPPQETEEKLN